MYRILFFINSYNEIRVLLHWENHRYHNYYKPAGILTQLQYVYTYHKFLQANYNDLIALIFQLFFLNRWNSMSHTPRAIKQPLAPLSPLGRKQTAPTPLRFSATNETHLPRRDKSANAPARGAIPRTIRALRIKAALAYSSGTRGRRAPISPPVGRGAGQTLGFGGR